MEETEQKENVRFEPRRKLSEQERVIEEKLAQLDELKLRVSGNKRCGKGCGGRGYYGIRTVGLGDGRWEPYLELCDCARPSEYVMLTERIDRMYRLLVEVQAMTVESLWKWTFWGGPAWIIAKVWAWLKARVETGR